MSRELYNYKRTATTTAKDLRYPVETVKAISEAKSVIEIANIMKRAREMSE